MSKFRKFSIGIIIAQLIVWALANAYLIKEISNPTDRAYMVEVSRIVNRMEAGEKAIDLSDYRYVTDVKVFDPSEQIREAYVVKEINGKLYCFTYLTEGNLQLIIGLNCLMGFLLLATLFLLSYLGRKLIKPFEDIRNLPVELAKGNLSIPIKEEKSKYFGQFLWGMNMLRDTLEEEKRRELELIRERKTLILSLSHDIKTPLSAIDLYGKALSSNLYKDQEDKRQEALLGIERNVAEIKDYMGQIVEASREDFMTIEVKNTELYLKDCIDEIRKYYGEKLERLHTDFIVGDFDNCLIQGDRDRIVEVIQNIMENAIKYGDGRQIELSFSKEEDCQLITIRNTGNTIKEDELSHLFESFYRGSNSERVEGSGLGLFICKSLMKQMEGDIFAKSEGDKFAMNLVLMII